MPKKHYTAAYLMNPTHPITISIIGCGGTGAYVVTQLAKISKALSQLSNIELSVKVYDDDIIEDHNVGRQLFSESDIGHNKANVIVSRVNRFYGLNWEAHIEKIEKYNGGSNILITCTDNLESRKMIHDWKIENFDKNSNREYEYCMYWLDFGNSKDYGQHILSTFGEIEQPKIRNTQPTLPDMFDMFENIKEDKTEPSCSMLESLNQQDLFINLNLAVSGIGLLWKLLKDHQIEYQGQFLNLSIGKTTPILIK